MTTRSDPAGGHDRATDAPSVADVMVRGPWWCRPDTTVADLLDFFADEHVHAALVVDGDTLVTVVERADLVGQPPTTHAAQIGTVHGRTVRDTAQADEALRVLLADGRRRLAVVDGANRCVGLLCLKRSGTGFCSDDDVAARATRLA